MNEEKKPENIPSGVVMKEMMEQIIPKEVKNETLPNPGPEMAINTKPVLTQESMRTYESDLAKALAQKKTSAITIAMAESKKKDGTDSISNVPAKNIIKPLLLVLASLILLGGGVTGGYALYLKSPLARPKAIPIPSVLASLIPSDKKISLNTGILTGKDMVAELYSQISRHTLSSEKILEIEIADTASDFIKKANVNMPDILLRSLTDRWMFGVYAEETGQQTPFVAFTTDFFQNAFAGMLSWEKTMAEDLSLLLNYKKRAVGESEKASSTVSSYYNIQGQFTDKQLRNRDVRAFTINNGELLFLYSFINKEMFVITATESTFLELIDRIEKHEYVR